MPLPDWSFRFASSLTALLPSACALCASDCGAILCGQCKARHLPPGQPRCRRCALPLPATEASRECGACLHIASAFDATFAAADYGPPIDQLVIGFKFAGQLALGAAFAASLRDAVLLGAKDDGQDLPALLTCVPLGEQRLVQRGYNQALEIARPLGKALAIEVAPALLWRTRETAPQSLSAPGQRRSNLRNAFTIDAKNAELVQGRHVGVVDDVMTTGETLEEVARTLKRYGAAKVTNFVFARTPPQ